MILKRFFRRAEAPERRLYEAIVAAARHRRFYESYGVADSLDGRFDMIVLHLYLVLARLKGGNAVLSQALVDVFFDDMDRSLREMGVGDLSVGKKVRKMAEAFYGRITAYDHARAEGGTALAAALARNLFPDGDAGDGPQRLQTYLSDAAHNLAGQDAETIASGLVTLIEPAP